MFRLLRYFSTTSLVTFCIIAVLLGMFYRQIVVNNLIELGEQQNVALTQAFANSLWSQFIPLMAAAPKLSSEALRVHPDMVRLYGPVLALMRGLSVVKVKIYNTDGLTVFSTQASQIGEDKSKNAGFRTALSGKVISELTHRDTFSAFEGVIEDRDMLSSYIPIHPGGPAGEIEGVFELYDDVTPLVRKIDQTQKQVVGGVILIVAALYTVLFLIVRHADRIMRHQHKALQEARDALEQRVKERTVALLSANAQLKEEIVERQRAQAELHATAAHLARSNHEWQDFVTIASHDLQEPLRKIQVFGDRLRSTCSAALGEPGRGYLERMHQAAGRMQLLLNDFLAFTRVTTQAQPFVLADLTAVAQTVVSELAGEIEQVSGRVEISVLPHIHADPGQMQQLFQNLIGNALKFHRQEEAPMIKVCGQLLSGELAPRNGQAPATDFCQITVADNGIGFDTKYLDRIFTVFERLHNDSTYAGTGVGLAVCRKIVERHGRSITAQSTPGQGATFIATLPVHPKGDHVLCNNVDTLSLS